MNKSEQKFLALLDLCPFAKPYFKIEQNKIDLKMKELGESLHKNSSGEQEMIKFLAGVFLGENLFNFDIIKASKLLGVKHLIIIANWLERPFFP